MIRLIFVILLSIPFALRFIFADLSYNRKRADFSEQDRYDYVRSMTVVFRKNARIRTDVYGLENLPETSLGYVMYPNHQGRYDAIGLIGAHPVPCTVMIDKRRSYFPIVSQLVNLLDGCRLDKTNLRRQLKAMRRVTEEVMSGRKYIIFPEGVYKDNKNSVQTFRNGAFKPAMRAHCPIVPVALVDSYKPFFYNSLKKVTTQVHFLKPLLYEEYKEMSSAQIAVEVRKRIVDCIASVTS